MNGAHRSDSPEAGGLLLKLDTNMASIDEGRAAILEHLAPLQLDLALINRLEVVFEELISNIVRHNAAAHAIHVELDCSDEGITLVVEDDGSAFNPFEMSDPAGFTSLEDAKLGGLGIPLIRRLAKKVSYERSKTAGSAVNRVRATLPLETSGSQSV